MDARSVGVPHEPQVQNATAISVTTDSMMSVVMRAMPRWVGLRLITEFTARGSKRRGIAERNPMPEEMDVARLARQEVAGGVGVEWFVAFGVDQV